ncbi:MAG: nitroreductase family protein [Dehalococcoidales bacterium]|nr:MAG: nitroreductase family protein [Dehalococcoidales bacterium]
MLTVWEAIKTRRSIRKFAPDDVPDKMIEQILEAARLAPSGSNRQPWRFMVVKDQESRQALCRICAEQKFIEEAPVVIVCFGDPERYSRKEAQKRRQEFAESGVLETLSGRLADPEVRAAMELAPEPSPEQVRTPVIANTYIAIEHMVLMATALGLGTCWVGAGSREINRYFGVGDELVPVAVVPVGYPAGKYPSERPRVSMAEILVEPQIPAKVEKV